MNTITQNQLIFPEIYSNLWFLIIRNEHVESTEEPNVDLRSMTNNHPVHDLPNAWAVAAETLYDNIIYMYTYELGQTIPRLILTTSGSATTRVHVSIFILYNFMSYDLPVPGVARTDV